MTGFDSLSLVLGGGKCIYTRPQMQDGSNYLERLVELKLTSTSYVTVSNILQRANLKSSCISASCKVALPACQTLHKWEIIAHNSATLQVLGLGIEVWKHLLRYEKDNTFVYVFCTVMFSNTTSPWRLRGSNHNCSSTIFTFSWPRLGQGNLALGPSIQCLVWEWI